MRRILRIFLWILGIVVVLTAGAYAYLRNADLSVYEEQIEGFLSEAIGHKIDFDGLFELHFGNLTVLTAEEVRISNIEWEPEPVIMSVGYFSVTVNLWSLISGPIIVEDLEVREVRIRLEKNEDAEANWSTGRVREKSEPRKGTIGDSIIFREVRVEDVQFIYLNPARRRPLNINLEQLTINLDESHVLVLDMNATINEIPVSADGKVGPWENLVDGNDINADLDIPLGQGRISIEGSVDNLPKLIGTEVSISITGPAFENVTETLGLPPFAEGEFLVDARIGKLVAGSQLRLEGNIGAIDMVASGTVDSLIKFRTAQLDFNVSGPDTQYVAEVFGVAGAPAVPFLISGDVNKQDSRVVFSGTRVQLGENILGFDGWLDFRGGVPDGDLAIEASGPDFSVVGPFAGVEGMPAETFEISGRVQKQGKSVRFDDLKAVIGPNRIQAHGAIGEEGSLDTQIEFNATGPDISILGPITGLQGIQPRAFDISAIVKPDRVGIRIENAKGDFGEIQVAVDGVVATAKGMDGTDLRLHANGTDLREIALLAGVPMLPDGPFDVGVRAQFQNKEIRLSEGTVSVADMNGTASGLVFLGAKAGDFDLDLSVNGPDLADALQFDWLERLSGEPFSLQGRLEHRSGEFKFHSVNASISDFEIEVDGDFEPADATGDITLRASAPDAEELRKLIDISHLPEGAVSVSGRIEKQGTEMEFSDVMASIGDYSIAADGTLSTSPLSNRSDLRFSASGPELREVGLLFDYDDLPAKPFSVSGEVNGIPTGFAIEKLIAKIGENNIDGHFTADFRDKAEVTGFLSSSFVDLRIIDQATEAEEVAAAEKDPEFLFSREPLATEWMQAANVDVTVKTGRLMLPFGDLQDFQIAVLLRDGALNIEPISFRESEGSVSGSIYLGPVSEGHELAVTLSAENMHISLLASKDQDRSTVPPISGQIEFRGMGNSVHDLMASSNGNVALRYGSGLLRDLTGRKLFGDLTMEIIRTLNPLYKQQQYTTLDCAIYDIAIEDGIATIKNVAMQTGRMAIVARGNLNLGNEQLNLTMQATPREGLGISIGGIANSFLQLGGTLRSPRLQIDPTSSITTTSVAVATAGWSLVAKGLWDRVKANTDICEELDLEGDSQ
jgi:uncharacterized protein involved in outer membrane biogenesis